jgi:tRNA/tmRNA/rRNA uracil-C5-methylase (TrmA/RlmC/RlmD family)
LPAITRCGGNVLVHVAYERQRRLKGEIIRDAFVRIGRVALERDPEVIGSPERGYRMRARLSCRERKAGLLS